MRSEYKISQSEQFRRNSRLNRSTVGSVFISRLVSVGAAMKSAFLAIGFILAFSPWVRSANNYVGGRLVSVSNDKLNWFTASETCRSHGKELLEIKSTEENAEVYDLLRLNNLDEVWIDLTDLGTEGVYVWSTSGRRTLNTFWAKASWNGKGGEEDCVTISSTVAHPENWFDRKCLDTHYYICQEKDANVNSNTGIDVRSGDLPVEDKVLWK